MKKETERDYNEKYEIEEEDEKEEEGDDCCHPAITRIWESVFGGEDDAEDELSH